MRGAIIAWLGLSLAFLAGCANQVRPTGGPRDQQGPKITAAYPYPGATNIDKGELTIRFDEYIRPPVYGQDFFISPLPENPPKIILIGKKLKLKFRDALLPNTTYVINFVGLKDHNEGNVMEEGMSLAFSTGSQIDSLEISGKVVDQYGQGKAEVSIFLFEADSVEDHDIYGRKPIYLTKSGAGGRFRLSYLRRTRYGIYGVMDKDQSNSWSSHTEALALAERPWVVLDTGLYADRLLVLSLPDTRGPIPESIEWMGDSLLRLSFSEGLRSDSLSIAQRDSLGESYPVKHWNLIKRQLWMWMPLGQSLGTLQLTGLMDSLGIRGDTVLALRPGLIKKLEKPPLVSYPYFISETGSYTWHMPHVYALTDSQITLVKDTTEEEVPAVVRRQALQVWLETPRAEGETYRIRIDGSAFGEPDTTYYYPIKSHNVKNYSRYQGRLDVRGYEGPVVLYLMGSRMYEVADTLFDFRQMLPGKYDLKVLLDEDGSRSWTPGSIRPYRLPERLLDAGQTQIRIGWEFEDQLIELDVLTRDEESLFPTEVPNDTTQAGSKNN